MNFKYNKFYKENLENIENIKKSMKLLIILPSSNSLYLLPFLYLSFSETKVGQYFIVPYYALSPIF